jgi:hypothetical protein
MASCAVIEIFLKVFKNFLWGRGGAVAQPPWFRHYKWDKPMHGVSTIHKATEEHSAVPPPHMGYVDAWSIHYPV